MKTKREMQGRECREMVEIDCSSGPRHRDFIYRIPTSLPSTSIFRMLDMIEVEKNMLVGCFCNSVYNLTRE